MARDPGDPRATVDARAMVRAKRDGARHAPGAVRAWIDAYTRGDVPDYQMSAWLMAVYFQGLDDAEAFELTEAMLHSGRVLRFEGLPGPTVDKHSTGGVGDKISLPLAPLVAACGAYVPMISGRGLGHTGGTLDKLESIPGFTTALDPERFQRQVRELGLAFGAQTKDLAPADGKLYALRDVTATVESIPLIIASILSKKYASGTEAVVFDVKTGRGAFMRELEQAQTLARGLLDVSKRLGRRATALVTNMDQPLGRAVGNALEVAESVEILKGGGPGDVRELTLALASEMLVLAGLERDLEKARTRTTGVLDSGAAFEKFRRIVREQGGDVSVLDEPAGLPRARRVEPVVAPRSGRVTGIDSYAVGEAVVALGGGRRKAGERIDPAVGIILHVKVGDAVEPGGLLAEMHTSNDTGEGIAAAVRDSFEIRDQVARLRSLVLERVE
ncbi:MAG: thymidine phosphorylase [Candidatus Eiseniibacteriota bacterium]